MPGNKRQVIVIGGGISGMSAAKLLHDQNIDVLVLEARDRVGGRTHTVRNDKVKYVDIGGSYVGPTQNRVIRLAEELGIQNYKVFDEDAALLSLNGGRKKYYSSMPTSYNPFVMMDIIHFWKQVDILGEQIPVDAPWNSVMAEEWDNMTTSEWLDKICWFSYTKKVAEAFARTVFATETHNMSLLFFLWYVKNGGGIYRIISTENGGQERKLIGGSQQISEGIADRLGDENLHLEHPVKSISQEGTGITLTTVSGKTFEADYVISAVPMALLGKMSFNPPLSPLKNQLSQRIPMGSCIKTMTYYERPFWRGLSFSGFILTDDIVAATIDDTKPDGSLACLVGFVNGKFARKYSSASEEERKMLVAKCYAKVFGSDEALRPTNYVEKNWMEEEYSGGCYMGATPPGVLSIYGKVMREPAGQVYFAGTETANHWSGYMEGAVQAGERAAREVLHAQGKIKKQDIWQVEPDNPDWPYTKFEMSFLERMAPSISGLLGCVGTCATGLLVAGLGVMYNDQIRSFLGK
ncbi:amine oxidase [flavin-containing] B [Strongylocentrotus purpuratus]|uniref:Amine oxidase n=1 Tax=Strongylocentrotus purpuratus TaxID=7668 RepID=A0A7M7GGQ7_STRPU|nr:amine oxidase [flavin-containing] B [Strongylocentrotus purpuratus]|eukprot:XP_003725257.1 PREDICTED: amine oxidase [flavin-containing] B isoform X1 [Strongylocentrotus purpuratus]